MKFVLSFVGVIALVAIASTVLIVAGEAPQCAVPPTSPPAKSEAQIGDMLRRDRRVTITNLDATNSASSRLGSVVTDPRVCFDSEGGHASGKFSLGPLGFSAYMSAASSDINLSADYPKISKLDIRLGSLPSVPGISDAAGSLVAGVVNQRLTEIKIERPLAAQFTSGSVTVREQ